jgi:hypothetical protein
MADNSEKIKVTQTIDYDKIMQIVVRYYKDLIPDITVETGLGSGEFYFEIFMLLFHATLVFFIGKSVLSFILRKIKRRKELPLTLPL